MKENQKSHEVFSDCIRGRACWRALSSKRCVESCVVTDEIFNYVVHILHEILNNKMNEINADFDELYFVMIFERI